MLLRIVTIHDIEKAIRHLVKASNKGEPWAIKELLNRCTVSAEHLVPQVQQPLPSPVLPSGVADGTIQMVRLLLRDKPVSLGSQPPFDEVLGPSSDEAR
jgi:hypothetical protein